MACSHFYKQINKRRGKWDFIWPYISSDFILTPESEQLAHREEVKLLQILAHQHICLSMLMSLLLYLLACLLNDHQG